MTVLVGTAVVNDKLVVMGVVMLVAAAAVVGSGRNVEEMESGGMVVMDSRGVVEEVVNI
jgi:hypothetical protein